MIALPGQRLAMARQIASAADMAIHRQPRPCPPSRRPERRSRRVFFAPIRRRSQPTRCWTRRRNATVLQARPAIASQRLPSRGRALVSRAMHNLKAYKVRSWRSRSLPRRKSKWASRPRSASRYAIPARFPHVRLKSATRCRAAPGWLPPCLRPSAACAASWCGRWEPSSPARRRKSRCRWCRPPRARSAAWPRSTSAPTPLPAASLPGRNCSSRPRPRVR